MEKKTIGSFIAVLRKASGMTQQEMADRLNISNKAVSRWERDECLPDVSLVPAIAEMFGVSCDELLKGERITGNFDTEKTSPKIEKQIKRLLNNALSRFKSVVYITIAGNLIGFILLLAISYGFYKPIIGFSVLTIFIVASLILIVLSLNRLNDQAKDNELFDNLNETDANYFRRTRYRFAFISLLTCAMSFLWSLPFIMIRDDFFVDSVIVFDEYIRFIPLFILITIVIYLVADYFCRRAFLGETKAFKTFKIENEAKTLNIVHFSVAFVIFSIAIIIDALRMGVSSEGIIGAPLQLFIIVLMLFGLLSVVYFAIKKKDAYKLIIITGARNVGCFIAAMALFNAYISVSSYIEYYGWKSFFHIMDFGNMQYLSASLLILAISTGGYALLKKYWVKR